MWKLGTKCEPPNAVIPKKIELISKSILKTKSAKPISQSKSMSRTTFKPDRHPKYTAAQNAAISTIQDLQIAIEVMPVINLEQLRAEYEEALNEEALMQKEEDHAAWKYALSTEISRCSPKPMWMKRKLEHPSHPTQHARIDQNPEQLKQLVGILSPETLRRTFISIAALMTQIRLDIGEHLKKI